MSKTALTWPVYRAIGRVVGWLWELVGWGDRQPQDGHQLIVARGPVARWMRRRRWAGFTFGNTIWIWGTATRYIVMHERQHVEQGRRLGLLFPVLYVSQLLRHGYRDNRFEVEAREAADRGACDND